jgi:hypothetical protein
MCRIRAVHSFVDGYVISIQAIGLLKRVLKIVVAVYRLRRQECARKGAETQGGALMAVLPP